jgi:hypothetical protein
MAIVLIIHPKICMTWFTLPVCNQLERTRSCATLWFNLNVDTKHYPHKFICQKNNTMNSKQITCHDIRYSFLKMFIITVPNKSSFKQQAEGCFLLAWSAFQSWKWITWWNQYLMEEKGYVSDSFLLTNCDINYINCSIFDTSIEWM